MEFRSDTSSAMSSCSLPAVDSSANPDVKLKNEGAATDSQENVSGALESVAATLSELHDALSSVRTSLALTINSIYQGMAYSVPNDDALPQFLVTNLEYQIDLADAFAQLSADTLLLDEQMLAFQDELNALIEEVKVAALHPAADDFLCRLIVVSDALDEFHFSFLIDLCRTQFLNCALAFSKQFLYDAHTDRSREERYPAALTLSTIRSIRALSHSRGDASHRGDALPEETFIDLQAAMAAVNESARDRDGRKFDRAFTDCDRLTAAFISAIANLRTPSSGVIPRQASAQGQIGAC